MKMNNPSAFLINKALDEDSVSIVKERTKEEALDFMIELIGKNSRIHDKKALRKAVYHRESLMSTGIGLGIAVPHARLDSVNDIVMAAGICETPIEDYQSLDNQPVRIIFLIAAHTGQHAEHIRLLAALSQKCKEEAYRNLLFSSKDTNSLYRTLTGMKRDE